MRLLLDEDSQGRALASLLRKAGHDVLTVNAAGLQARSDAEVYALAKRERRALITRNIRDFMALHIADSNHAGILGEHQDRDPAKNMSDSAIAQAVGNIEASGWDIRGQFVALNAWNYPVERKSE